MSDIEMPETGGPRFDLSVPYDYSVPQRGKADDPELGTLTDNPMPPRGKVGQGDVVLVVVNGNPTQVGVVRTCIDGIVEAIDLESGRRFRAAADNCKVEMSHEESCGGSGTFGFMPGDRVIAPGRPHVVGTVSYVGIFDKTMMEVVYSDGGSCISEMRACQLRPVPRASVKRGRG